MKLQRKKASFNSKCAKFESKEPLAKKDSLAKQTVKMFEDFEGMAVREKDAMITREHFEKKKEIFKDENEENVDTVDVELTSVIGEVKKKKSLFEQQESVEEDEKEALEKQKRREEFIEKQTLFGQ